MKYIYICGALLVASALFAGCESPNSFEDTIPGIVSVGKSGVITLMPYNVGEIAQQEMVIVKGGSEDTHTTVHFSVSKALLDSLNQVDGTSYQLLPESCYTFSEKAVSMNAGVKKAKMTFSYDPSKIEELGGYNTINYVLPLVVQTDGLPINKERNVVIYKFSILRPDVRMRQEKQESFIITDVMPEIKAYVEVLFNNKSDINLTFEGNADAVNEYNSANGTNYSLLPTAAYTLDPVAPMLKSGSNVTEITVKIQKDKLPLGDYMLPLKLASVSKFEVFPTATTSTFLISNPGKRLDKKDWTITANTEEVSGEGANNGHAIQLIDGDLNSFWHSQWKNGTHNPPHILNIDMKKVESIARIYLARRKDQAGTLHVNLEGSVDGQKWDMMGEFSVIQKNELQLYNVKPTTARYIRVTIPDEKAATPNTVAYLAEIDVYTPW